MARNQLVADEGAGRKHRRAIGMPGIIEIGALRLLRRGLIVIAERLRTRELLGQRRDAVRSRRRVQKVFRHGGRRARDVDVEAIAERLRRFYVEARIVREICLKRANVALKSDLAANAVELGIEFRHLLLAQRMQLLGRDGERRVEDDQIPVVLGAARILREPHAGRRTHAIRSVEIRRDRLQCGNDLLRDERFGSRAKCRSLAGRERLQAIVVRNQHAGLRRLRVSREDGVRGIDLDRRENDAALVLPLQKLSNGCDQRRVLVHERKVALRIGRRGDLKRRQQRGGTGQLVAAGIRRRSLRKPKVLRRGDVVGRQPR